MLSTFVHTCRKSGAYDFTDQQVEDLAKHFIRKYTNARIGGDIKGRGHRMAELKGQRGKGGAGLRDELYVMGGSRNKQTAKKSVTKGCQRKK